MTENKKEWSEPELVVLVRSKPEEAVLTGCKHGWEPIWDHGPYDGAGGCASPPLCTYCDAYGAS